MTRPRLGGLTRCAVPLAATGVGKEGERPFLPHCGNGRAVPRADPVKGIGGSGFRPCSRAPCPVLRHTTHCICRAGLARVAYINGTGAIKSPERGASE